MIEASRYEAERLETLHSLDLLDSEPEAEFEELVHLAAAICRTPMSFITLIDDKRQWFKAALGAARGETPREIAFCSHAIEQGDLFIVEDATQDPRFAGNPMVTGGPEVRFYAGMPLAAPNGYRVGTLCVVDLVPRHLEFDQRQALAVLGRQVSARMELRLQRRQLQRALAETKRVAAELEVSGRLFRTFMDHSPFVSYMKDEQGRFVFYNKALADRFGVDTEQWLGKTAEQIFSVETMQEFRANEEVVLERNEALEFIERSTEGDRTFIWRANRFPCTESTGRRLLAGISVDVTDEVEREARLQQYQAELEEANRRLNELAVTDALTGLANRRAFGAQLATDFARARRRPAPLSVIMMDLDDFKKVNDQLGHQAGDTVLVEFGKILRQNIRASDLAARYGGEEFVALLNETTTDQALTWVARLQQAMKDATWSHGRVLVSLGVATMDVPLNDTQTLIGRADEALYAAKRAGKNRAMVWSESMG